VGECVARDAASESENDPEEIDMADLLQQVRDAFARTDANDIDGFLAFHAPDCRWHTPAGTLHGHDGIRAFVEPFHTAFPDGVHELDRTVLVSDEVGLVQGRFVGTQTGPFVTLQGEVPPTGRRSELPFALIVERSAGTDTAGSVWLYLDNLTLMLQLGLMSETLAA
jgi:predicted ester cyclase